MVYIITKAYNGNDGSYGEEVLGYLLSEQEAKNYLKSLKKDSPEINEDNGNIVDFKFNDYDYTLENLYGEIRKGHMCNVTYTECTRYENYDYEISYKKIEHL